MVTKRVPLSSTDEAMSLFGALDTNINAIEKEYGVQIFIRHANGGGSHWPTLIIRGSSGKADKACSALQELRDQIKEGRQENARPVNIPEAAAPAADNSAIYVGVNGKAVRPRNAHQEEYVRAMQEADMVISIGPAGTGKTFVAVAAALAALKTGSVSRIILSRPVVEAGEKLGYLPGDFHEKINPYMKPMLDAFYVLLGAERFQAFKENEIIEIVPIAYMRGRTLESAVIILDEAQNTTCEQMKMFLTRMGEHSRMVITGDITQSDLEDKKGSGLVLINTILRNIPLIRFCYFDQEDVVRHALVKNVIEAFDRWERGGQDARTHPK